MKVLQSFSETIGKRVKAVDTSGFFGKVLLLFDDDSLIIFGPRANYDGDYEIDISQDFFGYPHTALVALGIMTEEQIAARKLANEQAIARQREEWDRERYEKLKAKFEK